MFCQFSEKCVFISRLYINWDTDCTLDQHHMVIYVDVFVMLGIGCTFVDLLYVQ